MKGTEMAYKHDLIDVRISQQILWIGSQAYPIKNISRAGTKTWVPRRGRIIWNFLKSVSAWLILGVLAAVAAGVVLATPDATLIGLTILLAVVVLKVVQLVSSLRSTFYSLNIETSGASETALVSKDGSVVHELVMRITDAINNPAAEFHMRVDNFNMGDTINQWGNNNTGKVVQ